MIDTENVNYPAPKQEYKVLVRCFTYNQSKYVEEALNGFTMQQTNFPFVCLVMDDNSTDGEQEVIKSWMERECDMSKAKTIDIPTSIVIFVPHKSNTSCTFAFYLLKQNLYNAQNEKLKHVNPWREKCEYEALCEGDDYWIDPHKLQKQIEFLDIHPEYSYSCHRYNILEDATGDITLCPNKYFDTDSSESFFTFNIEYAFTQDWITKTLTAIYRLSSYLEIDLKYYKYRRDVHLVYELLSKGKGVCHAFVGGVFRRNNSSTYNSFDNVTKKRIDYKVYKEFYEVNRKPILRHIAVKIYFDLLLKYKTIIKIESFSEFIMIIQSSLEITLKKIKSL